MKTKKRLLLVAFVLLALAPLMMADIGPKPEMKFTIEYDVSPEPEITTVNLLLCDQADCSDAEPLVFGGVQGIWCDTNTSCRSMANGYQGEYFQLVLEFSDGTSLTSNIFEHPYFISSYDVTVQADALLVDQVGGWDVDLDTDDFEL